VLIGGNFWTSKIASRNAQMGYMASYRMIKKAELLEVGKLPHSSEKIASFLLVFKGPNPTWKATLMTTDAVLCPTPASCSNSSKVSGTSPPCLSTSACHHARNLAPQRPTLSSQLPTSFLSLIHGCVSVVSWQLIKACIIIVGDHGCVEKEATAME